MDHFLSDAKRLVQRLQNHDNAVDVLIGETTNLQNKLIAMRHYRDEVNKMNQAANHRPRSTLILGSQLENQRIQNLQHENRELSVSLAEHQSALELIMNKYREQVSVMMKANGTSLALNISGSQPSETELQMSEQIAEMAYVMRHSAAIDESVAAKEIETIRSLQVENDNLRQLLLISGQSLSNLGKQSDEVHSPNANLSCNGITETVCNKDSGIYDEDISPNIDVFKKGKKRFPFVSKHAENLENLFKPPEVSDIPPENPIVSQKLNESLNNYDEDSQQFQFYTVEALIEPKEDASPYYKLMNGDLRDDFETPDSQSTPSFAHVTDVNNEFKDILLKSDESNHQKQPEDDPEDALQFLDDVLDLSDTEIDDQEPDEYLQEIACENRDDKDTDFTETNICNIDAPKENQEGNSMENYERISKEHHEGISKEHPKGIPQENPEVISKENPEEVQKESPEEISMDNPYKISKVLQMEESDNTNAHVDDNDITIQSDAESETTVTEENDALAMFDSILDDEMDGCDDVEDDN